MEGDMVLMARLFSFHQASPERQTLPYPGSWVIAECEVNLGLVVVGGEDGRSNGDHHLAYYEYPNATKTLEHLNSVGSFQTMQGAQASQSPDLTVVDEEEDKAEALCIPRAHVDHEDADLALRQRGSV